MTNTPYDLEKDIKERNIAIGAKVALKKLKLGLVERIYLAEDCPEEIINKIQNEKNKAEIIKLGLNKEELKETCKKPFNISIIAIVKEKVKKEEKKETKKTTKVKKEKKKKAK